MSLESCLSQWPRHDPARLETGAPGQPFPPLQLTINLSVGSISFASNTATWFLEQSWPPRAGTGSPATHLEPSAQTFPSSGGPASRRKLQPCQQQTQISTDGTFSPAQSFCPASKGQGKRLPLPSLFSFSLISAPSPPPGHFSLALELVCNQKSAEPGRGAAAKPFEGVQSHRIKKIKKRERKQKPLKKLFLFVVNNYLTSGQIHKFNKIRLC